ncbi:hypothetical protein EJ08DRAFT_702923 [Tothia fuscella]|uniref:DUF8004 domain-containing protein n=1 Tax=Tothia fuscella TaxID=1048955 RepID=A0A9P4NFB7_9PEZI|nr:hypothetical protein EJ08DRAFT_702923 [Tothia fuscella]
MEQRGALSAESLRSRITGSKVRHWDGRTRTTVPWDSLRRDPELWMEKGNCLVHLHAKCQSRRGPSFRVSLDEIQAAGFESIFSMFYNEVSFDGRGGTPTFDGTRTLPESAICELYIPAPEYSSKDDSFSWHISTRNFFAFLFGKCLVGASLSKSMIDVQERLNLLRQLQPDNQKDFNDYLERMGYLEFAHCPDYSLALLAYAEFYEQRELWVDSFVHCVGMNDMLSFSSEFDKTSRITKALICRAYLEMDLHLARVTKSLSNFLEEDFSSVHLGLSNGARAHLDRFRSFLYTYYVEKFGYWPPPKGTVFSKALCKSMYFDFRSLYDYLVDLDSNDSLQDQRFATGGICVLQNIQAFDARHKYIPLPHPHPLLPVEPKDRSIAEGTRSRMSLKMIHRPSKTDRHISARDALFTATNKRDTALETAPLVQAYRRFERRCTLLPEEKVSLTDGRKVRWMLIYGIVQMLVSVIRAPKEVRDVDSPTYPLCCLVAETFPWKGGAKALNDHHTASINMTTPKPPGSFDGTLSGKVLPSTPEPIIRPDCEGDNYFGHTNTGSGSSSQKSSAISNLDNSTKRRGSGIFRSSSFRSGRTMSLISNGRRDSAIVKPTTSKFSEILVQGYGNGLNTAVVENSNIKPYELSSEILPEIVVHAQKDQDFPPRKSPPQDNTKRRTCPGRLITPLSHVITEQSRTPIIDSFDLDKIHDPPSLDELDSPSDHSNSAPRTPVWSRSCSPSSDMGFEGSGVNRRTSTFSTNSTLICTPMERTLSARSINIKRTFSVDSFVHKELELHEVPHHSVSATAKGGVLVYRPSGAPLKKKYSSTNLRKKHDRRSFNGPLKRSDAVASNRRSLQIKKDMDLFEVLRLGPSAIV